MRAIITPTLRAAAFEDDDENEATCVIGGSIPSTLIRSAAGPLAVSFLFGSVATDAHAAPTAGAAAGLIEKQEGAVFTLACFH